MLFDDDCVRASAPEGSLYGAFTLGRAVTETDVLITLPKFKTHGFMMFTGAVKNLFGCIPGLDKAQYHLKVPDRDDFGEHARRPHARLQTRARDHGRGRGHGG